MSSIYFIQNTVNGKGYIGKVDKEGKTVDDRWREHAAGRGSAIHLFRAIKKYGSGNFIHFEVESALTPEQAEQSGKVVDCPIEYRYWVQRLQPDWRRKWGISQRRNSYKNKRGIKDGVASKKRTWSRLSA